MPVIGFDLVRSEPYLDGAAFGETGAYQRIDPVAQTEEKFDLTVEGN